MTQTNLQNENLFSNKKLLTMIFPLMIEQLLLISVGIIDVFMVSSVGEAAVSGISTVDVINILLTEILVAAATGGAVVISQYLGKQDKKTATEAAKQILYVVFIPSCILAVTIFFLHRQIITILFKGLEPAVMNNACTYFMITALSYPALAVFASCSAIYRAQGITKTSMFVSCIMNLVNISGNALLIYVFELGVAGAAIASMFSQIVGAIIMLILLTHPSQYIFIEKLHHVKFDKHIIKSILKIGIPGGLENSLFQMGKILLQGLVTSLGTTAIAANALANNIAGLITIPATAMCTMTVTVVGQCVGAKDYDQSLYYTKKLTGYSYITMLILSTIMFFTAPYIVSLYHLSAEVSESTVLMLRIFAVTSIFTWVSSFLPPNALRAAGDSTFTMSVSMISMWVFRVGLSYVFARCLNLGLASVWLAMAVDWTVRSLVFYLRLHGSKWKTKSFIS